ncbi:MAG TPA: hypothetical protein ENN41_00110, partial [Sediminispirochaeta sp.]|nr:hypothetical protein [Sediminispirochaeta sp.]
VLFYGEPYTGKLSTALETARALTCKGSGEWSCGCSSCRSHRVLDHPYVLMLGSRYFSEEISASAEALLRSRSTGARYLFIRALRKLTRRFDPLLWEGNEQKINKLRDRISDLEELIEKFYPESPLPEEQELRSDLEKINSHVIELSRLIPRETIPIDQIRAVRSWVHTSSSAGAKVIIIENADKMGSSSRNALLKILEEPPEAVHFILLSTRKAKIIPTILSRLRQYHFPLRSTAEEGEVMEKIFRIEHSEYPDLESFFLAWRGVPVERLRAQATHFFDYVWGNSQWEPEKLEEFLRDKNLSLYFGPFLQELSKVLQSRVRENEQECTLSYSSLDRWSQAIREALLRFEQFNQAPDLLLEGLLYSMKEMKAEQ